MHLAFAWGSIGANPSLAILQRWYESGEDRRSQCARIALSLSFPALMADPKTRDNDFLGRFAKDQLERDGNELQAHILLGLGLALTETEQNSDVFLKIGSTDVITRAAAAIGLAMRLGAAAEGALKEYLRGIHPTSFDRIMAVSAMSRFDAVYTKQLHQALCSMAPLNVWRIRHGIEPRLFDPYRWTAEVITALRRTKRGGASRARAWAEVLMFDDSPEIIELPPSDTELITRTPDPDHPNIRDLYKRMDSAFQSQDYAGVLHASANVFETLAKLIFADPNV